MPQPVRASAGSASEFKGCLFVLFNMNKHLLTVLVLGGYYGLLGVTAYKLFQPNSHVCARSAIIKKAGPRVTS